MKTAIATDDGGSSRSLGIVRAMLAVTSYRTRREVHAALAAELHAPAAAAELRVAELGFLSSLLTGPVSSGSVFVACERVVYDETRPAMAPSSRSLVERYGSWLRACKAAYGLQADGTTLGPGKPWITANRGEPAKPFTEEDGIGALRQCADELRASGFGSVPTTSQYDEWVRRRKLRARRTGVKLRLPYTHNLYRLFGKRKGDRSHWHSVLRAAGLLDKSA